MRDVATYHVLVCALK